MKPRGAALSLMALLAALPPVAAQSLVAGEHAALLAELVDQPTRAARARMAGALAQKHATRFAEFEQAAREFGRFEVLAAGSSTQRVSLQVGIAREDTELVLQVPAGYDPAKPAPALLAFHGTGGDGASIAQLWRATADELGMVLLCPSEAGANTGYRFSQRERDAALAALRWLRRRVNIDENAVFASGVSRGGHLAWDLALRHPDLFAGIAPLIGGPRISIANGQNNLRYIENVAALPIRDLQGAQDDPALVASVELAFEKLKALGARDARLHLQPEHGHSFDPAVVDWKAFFALRRDPRPERVVRAAARTGEGRAFWLEVLELGPAVDEVFTPKVSELKWANLSAEEQRRFLAAECERRTARMQAQRTAPGHFALTSSSVKRARLLLSRADLAPDGSLEVAWNGDTLGVRRRPSLAVLLAEFAERFDRTFLPSAELELR